MSYFQESEISSAPDLFSDDLGCAGTSRVSGIGLGEFGCGSGCQCAQCQQGSSSGCGCSRCRAAGSGLGERYVDDEDEPESAPPVRRPSTARVGPGPGMGYSGFALAPASGLTQAQVQAAVAQNQTLSQRLGWDVLYDAIASWILRFRNMTPAAHTFAQSVAAWQSRHGMPANGIIDAQTWSAMLADAKAGIPRPFQTPEGVARPHGLQAIVATFGDPTQRGWAARNITPITAPTGQTFAPGVRQMQVHRLIAPQFDRVFAAINRAGLWNDFFPSAGTWVCRTKFSHGKQPCGTPGIQAGQLSNHSWGIAVDFRAANYPFYTTAMQNARRPLRYPPATITQIFQDHGFHFGLWFMNGTLNQQGRINFNNADPMHFQYATGY